MIIILFIAKFITNINIHIKKLFIQIEITLILLKLWNLIYLFNYHNKNKI